LTRETVSIAAVGKGEAALDLVHARPWDSDAAPCKSLSLTAGSLEQAIKAKDGLTLDLSDQYLASCNSSGWSVRA
jgi:hypothetical protein